MVLFKLQVDCKYPVEYCEFWSIAGCIPTAERTCFLAPARQISWSPLLLVCSSRVHRRQYWPCPIGRQSSAGSAEEPKPKPSGLRLGLSLLVHQECQRLMVLHNSDTSWTNLQITSPLDEEICNSSQISLVNRVLLFSKLQCSTHECYGANTLTLVLH